MTFLKYRLICFLILFFAVSSCISKNKRLGNSISFNIGGEPSTINPLSASDAYSSNVHSYIFESLLDRDPETYEWKPLLAKKWDVSSDKKVFTYYLRENVFWHDGTPLTAEDVKFSYDVIFSDDWKAIQLRPYYESIKSVEVIDKFKVRFTVKDDYFMNFDVCSGLTILPKHFYSHQENKKIFGKKLVGTGPYIFSKYKRGQKIVLKQNPKWWGRSVESEKDKFQIKKINLKMVGEESVYLELLKKGELDFQGLRPEGYIKKTKGDIWKERIIKVKTENKTPKGYSFIAFNLNHPILKDRNVRKALSMLFNRPLMIEKFEFNLAELATGPIYVQSDYASPNVSPVPFDPKAALKILKEAGWSDSDKDGVLDKIVDGQKRALSFTIMEPLQDVMKYLTIFKEDAKKVGVDIKLKNIEWNSFVKLLDEKNFEAVRLAWSGGSVNWDPKQIWHSSSSKGSGSNFISYANDKVDVLIDEARQIHEKEERVKRLRKVHELISADYPYIWWFNSKYTLYGHSKRVQKKVDTYKYGIGQEYWTVTK